MAMDRIIQLSTSSTEEALKLKNMKAEVDREKILQQYTKLQADRKNREALDIDPEKDYKPGSLTAQNKKFQQVIQKKLPFINEILSTAMCVAANTIYLMGAITGGGKSTCVANLIIPLLEKQKRVLVISNEEPRNHVYARVACRTLAVSFIKWTKNELSESVLDRVDAECERLATIMTVIGTDFQDNSKFVTTPEGLEIVFNKFAPSHEVILFDYFQNISHSINNPDPQTWPHQEKFCYFINEFKNRFDGPIFIMSQLWPTNKNNTVNFLERIKGRKAVGDISMVHIEILTKKEDYTTTFVVHKDRLWNNDGVQILMGFDRETGRVVRYDDAFKQKATSWIAQRLQILAADDTAKAAADASASAQAHAEVIQEQEETKYDFSDELDLTPFD